MSTLFQNFFKIFFSFCFYSDYLKNLISFKDQNNKLVCAVFYFNCDFLLLIYILYFMCFHLLFNTWNIISYCNNKVNAFFADFLFFCLITFSFLLCYYLNIFRYQNQRFYYRQFFPRFYTLPTSILHLLLSIISPLKSHHLLCI